MCVTGLEVPARAPAGAPGGGVGRGCLNGECGWGGGVEAEKQRSPRLPAPHTQVLLSAGVLLQLLARDGFNYFRSLPPLPLPPPHRVP